MAKTIKEINIAPAMKNKRPMNIMKREKTVEKQADNLPSTINEIPKPILSLDNNRKSVDAKDNDKLMMARLV
jgi:hypothetical protein